MLLGATDFVKKLQYGKWNLLLNHTLERLNLQLKQLIELLVCYYV